MRETINLNSKEQRRTVILNQVMVVGAVRRRQSNGASRGGAGKGKRGTARPCRSLSNSTNV